MRDSKASPTCIVFESVEALRNEGGPGSVHFSFTDLDGEQYMSFRCPCGCGDLTFIMVGKNFKPQQGPSWKWNGDTTKPTLEPSVDRKGHWHGYLTDGKWVPV